MAMKINGDIQRSSDNTALKNLSKQTDMDNVKERLSTIENHYIPLQHYKKNEPQDNGTVSFSRNRSRVYLIFNSHPYKMGMFIISGFDGAIYPIWGNPGIDVTVGTDTITLKAVAQCRGQVYIFRDASNN